jgi:hypothetical protein
VAANSDDHIQHDIDVQVLVRGMNVPVFVDDDLAEEKWVGGQFVAYTSNTFGRHKNVRVVTKSDGNIVSGFLLRASERHPAITSLVGQPAYLNEYNYSSIQPSNTRIATMFLEGSCIFKYFERYGFGNRTSSGTELTYTLGQALYVSERGLITTLADATAAGVAVPKCVGSCWLVPSEDNGYRIGLDSTGFDS